MVEPLEKIALALDEQIAHVWMVRTFLKHSEEAEEDEELCDVHRTLYDFMHALGAPRENRDWPAMFKLAKKKFGKLRKASELWQEIQPEISGHTSFQMSRASLTAAVSRIGELLDEVAALNAAPGSPAAAQHVPLADENSEADGEETPPPEEEAGGERMAD